MFLQVKAQFGTNEIIGCNSTSQGATTGDIETGDIDLQALNLSCDSMRGGIFWWDGPMTNGSTAGVLKENFKSTKFDEINSKTGFLVESGVDWNSKRYVMPEQRQAYYLSLGVGASNGDDMTGKKIQSLDGSIYSFTNAADFWSWWDVMQARVESLVEGGMTLAGSVYSAANTQAAMDAIVDGRS